MELPCKFQREEGIINVVLLRLINYIRSWGRVHSLDMLQTQHP